MNYLALCFSQLQLDSICQQQESKRCLVIVDAQQQLCQLNSIAYESGLRLGMKLGTASALVPEIHWLEHDSVFEARRLQELAEDCYRVSADIVIMEPDVLLFEVRSMLKLHGNLENYLQQLNAILLSQGVHFAYALAEFPLAAKILACSRKVSANLSFRQENTQQALAALDISALRLSPKRDEKLRRLGLNSLADLNALLAHPEAAKQFGARLGVDLLACLQQLRGDFIAPLAFFKPKQVFRQSMLLEHEIQNAQSLSFPLKNLLQSLQAYLQAGLCRVQCLHFFLQERDGQEQCLELLSAEPERDSQRWLDLLRLKLESLQLQAPVIGLRLEANQLLEEQAPARDLFDVSSAMSPEHLLGRLQAKLGTEQVQALRRIPDHRPEYASAMQAVRIVSQAKPESDANGPHQQALLRPSLLLEQAVPLSESIRIVHGPERIQAAWWTEQAICRDYFVARNTSQQLLWVYRDADQNWFVQGLFA